MVRKVVWLVLIASMLLGMVSLAAAQDEMTVLASGLNSPRQLFIDQDGTVYIAEAGIGGDKEGKNLLGSTKFGTTGQITAVTPDGEQTIIISDLVSTDTGFGQIYGAGSIVVTDDSYWVAVGDGPSVEGLEEGQHVAGVIQVAKDDMAMEQFIDVGAWEAENNPDQNPDDLVSNPVDLALAEDGTLYIVDASGNSLISWTAADGLQLVAAWPMEGETAAVPTAVALAPNGDIVVGFLGGFPFTSSRIEVWGTDGTLKKTYDKKLNLVTDVLVTADGSIYAVQMASGFGDLGFNPDSGSVVKVTDDGVEVIAENLPAPYGLAEDADGNFWASIHGIGGEEGNGEVVMVGAM
ncbi:MAG: ScyD/ScyE family protein [Anaerolineae bacterium]